MNEETDIDDKAQAITGVCFHWRGSGSLDKEVINLNGSASWKMKWVNIATEKQPPNRWLQV